MLREERIENLRGRERLDQVLVQVVEGDSIAADHSRWVMDNHLAELERVVTKINATEERMEAATKDDEVVQKLRAIKGVGLVTALVMRAEIGDFDRFASGKQWLAIVQ